MGRMAERREVLGWGRREEELQGERECIAERVPILHSTFGPEGHAGLCPHLNDSAFFPPCFP